MEYILNVNTRILIGQELGEIYLIIQQFINNKWQVLPNHKYRGNYFVSKKLKELSKYNICNVRKGKKIDMIKFKVAENTNVYLNDYSIIKEYPEIKKLDKILTQKLVYQKINNKMIIFRKQKHKIVDSNVLKLSIVGGLSLGILTTSSIVKSRQNGLVEQIDMTESSKQVTYDLISNSLQQSELVSQLEQYDSPITSESKLTENDLREQSREEFLIEKYAEMYYMDILKVTSIYNENYEEIVNNDNPEKIFLIKVKDAFYADSSIDKTPMISTMTSEEKEKIIIDFARNIYKIEDENNLALLLSIHRLEASYGNSRRCVEDNNPGGLKEENDFLTFKTFEIGAESFVRNVQKIVNQTKCLENYDFTISFEKNMQTIYCPGDNEWGIQVENIKKTILDNGELDIYLNENIEQNKIFIKKK